MKELYNAPELKIVSFVPAENLANSFDFDDMGEGNWNPGEEGSGDLILGFE